MAILLVGGSGASEGEATKDLCSLRNRFGVFLYSSISLYCPNHLFSDWPHDDLTRVFNTCSCQRVRVDVIISWKAKVF